jgi:hypothetical protein
MAGVPLTIREGIQEDQSATSGLKLQAFDGVRVQEAIPSLHTSGTKECVRLASAQPTTDVADGRIRTA